jgi:hypothetical protein
MLMKANYESLPITTQSKSVPFWGAKLFIFSIIESLIYSVYFYYVTV